MARYTGPVCRICRREGLKLYLKGEKCVTKCTLDKRPNPPGMHQQQRRRKASDYSAQLREKQKTRKFYGVGERQFRNAFEEGDRRAGPTGANLLSIMESRLDNVVHRLGLGRSRPEARQLVRHGHFLVNDVKTDIPSYQVKAGDTITVRPSSRESELFKIFLETAGNTSLPDWLSYDSGAWTGRVLSTPVLPEGSLPIQQQLVVEFYSR
jgi:small subunit ribosomal protein S4